MKYEDYDGPVEELVRMKIKEIENKENIRVLHAGGLKKSWLIINLY